jgi:hypothetical protein
MFTTKLPFAGRPPQEMMISRLRGKPTPLRQVRQDFPKRLEAVIMKSLETDAGDRYRTAWEFGEALVAAAEGPNLSELRRMLQ